MVAIRYLKCNSDPLVSEQVAGCYHPAMENRTVRHNNLLYAIHRAGGVATLAAAIHASEKYLRQIVQGFQGPKDKSPRKLGDKMAHAIATWLNEPPYWMDQPHPELWKQAGVGNSTDLVLKAPAHDVIINQFDPEHAGGSMGAGLVLQDQPGIIQSWRVSREWLEKNVRSQSAAKNLCIVTGFGDSMQPMFNPGDPLLVDIGVRSVEFDAVYFFRIEDQGFVKRLQRIPTENGLVLRAISENRSAYEPFDITERMSFEVLGRVLKVWRSQDF